jgi:hypothetical protein
MKYLTGGKKILYTALAWMVWSISCHAQTDPFSGDFIEWVQKDSVTISYKWKQYGLFKKDKPFQLVLKIENRNPQRISLDFRVGYYWGAVLKKSSDRVEYCVKPGKKIKGKLWDLVFESGGYKESQLKDPMFTFDLTEIKIREDPECRTRFNLKLRSSTPAFK